MQPSNRKRIGKPPCDSNFTRLHAVECMVLISQPFWGGQLRNEKFLRTDGLGDRSCRRSFNRCGEGAAGDAAYAGAKRSEGADGEGSRVGGHHRTKSDDTDAGRCAAGDGYLPAEK